MKKPGGQDAGSAAKNPAAMSDEELEREVIRRRRARSQGGVPPAGSTGLGTEPGVRRPAPGGVLARYFASLELAPGATLDEVKRAYHRLMRKYHPDQHVGAPERHKDATALVDGLTKAYQAIVDELTQKNSK